MYRGTIINSREDLETMSSSYSYQSTAFDNQSYHSTKQKKPATYYETDHSLTSSRALSPERARSADHSRTALNEKMPIAPSSSSTYTGILKNPSTSRPSRATNGTARTRSSTVYIDDLRTTEQEGEKRELNTLNDRFGNYLDKIKNLVNINTALRRQVDDAYRKYIGHTDEQYIDMNDNKKYQHPSEIQLNHLRKQINDEVRAQTVIQIRLQRADYDIKFYQNNIKIISAHDQKQSEQTRTMRQQFEVNSQELEQLKRQYESREQDLQMYKSQYNEYMNKLIQFSNQYDNITYERMEKENNLSTLKEQLSFEQEYYQRRQQEFEYLEQFRSNFNKEFNQKELQNIVKQIRHDYQEFNAIRLAELEILYKTKLETIRNQFTKREAQQEVPKPREALVALDLIKHEHRALIEQNQLLKNKLEQLEHDLHTIIEQNRQRYEVLDREYKQLQTEVPELDDVIVHLRENAVNLWSEINTYRYLLLNLLAPTHDKSQQRIPKCSPPPLLVHRIPPIEKHTTTSTTTENNIQESKKIISTTKPMINKTTTTTVGTKAKTHPQQYRDETTGFIVHIEDGIVWVRI